MARVVHFEINVDDPERAAQFYRDVFGWDIGKWDGPIDYWPITTGADDEPGINGALTRRSQPNAGTWNTIAVESVDDYVEKVVAAGGQVIMPKETIPGIGFFAYCQDTEGNIFGVLQPLMGAG